MFLITTCMNKDADRTILHLPLKIVFDLSKTSLKVYRTLRHMNLLHSTTL